jgi:hypothetical protein
MLGAVRPSLPLTALLCLPVAALAQGDGWRANPDLVRRLAQQRADVNYDEARVPPYTLPDVLAGRGGRVTASAQWPARREEILELFRDTVYGRSPGRPEHLDFQVLEENPKAMDGAATLRRVAIASRQGPRSHRFTLTLFLPNRPGKVPVFLFINNRAVSVTDPTRQEKSGFWPAERIVARGYGMATFHYGELAPDDKTTFRNGVMSLFDGDAGGQAKAYTWGALAAWGWGASRAMDYFLTDARVDAARVALVGHSRGGKAALWAGAEDPRFAMVVSNESGEGGAALSRRIYGETIERINTQFPHWFTAAYKAYNGKADTLPVDQHMLLALVAPRALYVASAGDDLWADPRGEFLSLAASSPVFALWGEPSIGAEAMPPIDTPLVRGRRGYHVRTGEHDLTPYDWDRFVDFAGRAWGE